MAKASGEGPGSSVVLLCLAVAVIGGFAGGMKPVVIPYLFSSAGISISEYGVLESASMLISSLILLRLARVPGKVLGAAAVAVSMASWILFASLAKHVVMAAYVANYLASVVIGIVIMEAVLETVEKYRAAMLGAVNSARFLASLASPLLAAHLLVSLGVRLTLLTVASLVAPNLLIVGRIAKSIEAGEHRTSLYSMLRRYRHATLFVVLVSLGAIPGSMYMVYEDIVGVYIGRFSPWIIGYYEALESLLVTLLMPLGGYLVDRMRRRWLVPAMSDALAVPYATCVLLGSWLRSPLVYLSAPLPDAMIASLASATVTLFKDFNAPTRQLLLLHSSLSDIIAATTTLIAGFMLDYLGVPATLVIVFIATAVIVLLDLTITVRFYREAVGRDEP